MLGEFAIMARGDPQQPDEGAPHHVNVAESGGRGHLLEPSLGAFELTTRRHHARLKYVLGRCCANLSSKYATVSSRDAQQSRSAAHESTSSPKPVRRVRRSPGAVHSGVAETAPIRAPLHGRDRHHHLPPPKRAQDRCRQKYQRKCKCCRL